MEILFCQVCGARNEAEHEYCRRCHQKLLVISGPPNFEDLEAFDGDDDAFSLDEHLLERISILEEVVKRQAETVRRTLETLYKLEQKILVNQTGVTTLRDLLEDRSIIAREAWSELWESRMDYHLLALEKRERFASVKGQMAALYRGRNAEAFRRQLDDVEGALLSLDIGDAVRHLEAAHETDPQNYELAFFLAETFFNEGRNERALEYFQKVLAAKPTHFESLVLGGVLLHELDRDREAVTLLERAEAVDSTSFLALFGLGAVHAAHERYDAAVPWLERAVVAEDLPQARFLLARCLYETGQGGRAIRHLERGLELDPAAAEAHELLGLAYLDRRWVRKAERALHDAQRLRPQVLRFDELHHLAGPEAGVSPGPAAASWRRGDALRQRGRAREALSEYRQALVQEPENPGLLLTYAMACLELGRGREVEPVVEKVLRLAPSGRLAVSAQAVRLEALRGEGRFREGLEVGRQLLADATSDLARSVVCFEMACNLADMDEDLDQALDLARRAMDLGPAELRHIPLAALGWIHYKRRELTASIELLSEARSQDPSPRALTQLGLALLAAGERDQARTVLHEAHALRRDEPDERFLEVLKEGSRLLHDPPIEP